jgi:hypothetical protein
MRPTRFGWSSEPANRRWTGYPRTDWNETRKRGECQGQERVMHGPRGSLVGNSPGDANYPDQLVTYISAYGHEL